MTQKTYSTKSTAQRAAAKELGIQNKADIVADHVTFHEVEGGWIFKNKPVKKAKPSTRKAARSTATFKRPGADTVTGRVWELADKLLTRAKVMEAGLAEGINPGTISQQYHRWNHQK